MQKQIIKIIFVFIFSLGLYLFGVGSISKLHALCSCDPVIIVYKPCTGSSYPDGSQCSTAYCGGNTCQDCGPGFYPDHEGCHPYEVIPPPPPDEGGPTPIPPTPAPDACYVTTSPPTWNLVIGQSQLVKANVTSGLGTASIVQMVFGSYDQNVAYVSTVYPYQFVDENPPNSSPDYSATVTANNLGSTAIWATAVLSDSRICQQIAGGTTDTDIVVTPPTCTISLSPGTTNLTLGGAGGTITATVNCTASVDQVTFDSSPTGKITITTPGTVSVANSEFTTTVQPLAEGGTIVTGHVFSGGLERGSATAIVNVTQPNAWFQTKDADVYSGTDLTTHVLIPNLFGLPGLGGFPGVPAYTNSTDLTNLRTSAIGWLVNNTATSKTINYQSLVSQIPADIVPTVLPATATSADFNATTMYYDYYWYKYTGSTLLTISGPIDFGNKKVILLVNNANLQIDAPINVTDGVGFFMVLVNGNITVGSGVGGTPPQANPNLEGLYLANGTFNDSVGNAQLWLRGSLVANGGVTLSRNLTINTNTPAELFEFAPDQILLYPAKLGIRRLNWKEVAP